MIEDRDIERLKEIFMPRSECNTVTDNLMAKLSNDDRRMAVIETYQKVILWVLVAVGGGVISMLVKMFFGE